MKDPKPFQPTTKHLVIIQRNMAKRDLPKPFRVAGKEKKQMQKLLIIINTKL